MQYLDRPQDHILRWQRSCSFNSEDELAVILPDDHCFGGQANISSELGALLAQRALVCILDLDSLLEVVQLKHLAWALGNEGLLLLQS